MGRLPQDSDEEEEEEEEEEELVGGGEGMAESVLGAEFLLAETRRSPAKSRIPTSATARSAEYFHFISLRLSDCLTHSLSPLPLPLVSAELSI